MKRLINKTHIISALCLAASLMPASAQSSSFFADFAVKANGVYNKTASIGVTHGKIVAGDKELDAVHGQKQTLDVAKNLLYCTPGTLTADIVMHAVNSKSLNMYGAINDTDIKTMVDADEYGITWGITSADFSHLDMSAITTLNKFLYNSAFLESINWGKHDLSKVTDADYAFANNEAMTVVPPFKDLKLTNIETMSRTFRKMPKIKTADFNGCAFTKVKSFEELFASCHALETVSFKDCGLSALENCRNMFNNCYNLTSVDFSGCNLGKVNNFYSAFSGCESMKSFSLNGQILNALTDCGGMFASAFILETVDFSECGLNNLTNAQYLFYQCTKLKEVDFSGCDLSKVNHKSSMFYNCSALTTVKVTGCNEQTIQLLQTVLSSSDGPGGTWLHNEATGTITKTTN